MHRIEAACLQLGRAAAAAVHVHDVHVKAIGAVKTGVACYVPGQHGIDRIGYTGSEHDALLSSRCMRSDQRERKRQRHEPCPGGTRMAIPDALAM